MAAGVSDEEIGATGVPTAVPTVYWRPGCPWCARLRRGLARADVATREVDIWQDPAAAAVVRSVATGNETVPTVVIGDRALVNPSVRQVLDALGLDQRTSAGLPAGAFRRVLGRLSWGAGTGGGESAPGR